MPPCRVPFFCPKELFLEARRGQHVVRHEQQRLAATATTRTRLEFGLGWPTPTNRGTGPNPQWGRGQFQGVRKRPREMRSLYGRARRPCCAQYAHRVNVDTCCIRLAYIGQGRLCVEMAFTSGSLPIASFSPDGAVRLLCIVSCLSSALFEHTDDVVVIEQGGAATQHAAVKL